jgi:hypothetical protein
MNIYPLKCKVKVRYERINIGAALFPITHCLVKNSVEGKKYFHKTYIKEQFIGAARMKS